MHLHVAHVVSVSLWGGPSQVVVNLLAEGRRRGWAMTLVLFEHPGAALERLNTEARQVGAEVVCMPLSGAFDPRLGTKLRALLQRLDPDVVHCHGYKPALAALLAEPGSRRARVLTVHGWSVWNWRLGIYEWLERRILAARFGRVFVVSPALRERLLEVGLSPEKVVLTPNAFDPTCYGEPERAAVESLRQSWGLAPGQPAVGALGRLSLEKGHDVLIRAMVGLPGARLVLIGDGAARPDLERLADQLRLQPRPVFAGETDRPLTALAALDVVALPSRAEGLPQSLLEAMALGRPVVASAVGAIPDAFDHGGAGLLVPPEDPGALRAALTRLLNDAGLARRLAALAHERVMRTYTPQALGDRLEGEYRALLDSHDAGSGGTDGVSPTTHDLAPLRRGVSVLIPTFQAERWLQASLDAIWAQTYEGPLEVLVADGRSTDGTRATVLRAAAAGFPIRLIDNPERLQAAGLNRAARASKYPILVRCDARSRLPPRAIELMANTHCSARGSNVGCMQIAVSPGTPIGSAIAAAYNTLVGSGGAAYRVASRPSDVDTAYLGSWWRDELLAAGGWSTEVGCAEDAELNLRWRRLGGRVRLLPEIRVAYLARSTLAGLFAQYARYGYWRTRVVALHWSIGVRQVTALAPLAAVLLLIPAIAWPVLAIPAAVYGITIGMQPLRPLRARGVRPLVPLVIMTMHLAWGTGFLAGLFILPFRRHQGVATICSP